MRSSAFPILQMFQPCTHSAFESQYTVMQDLELGVHLDAQAYDLFVDDFKSRI